MNDLSYICNMKANLIYGLRDPRNDVYYYIGKTTVGYERPLTHLTKSHNETVNQWVTQLEQLGLIPHIDVIEKDILLEELIEKEKYWIGYYYELNPKLLNVQLLPDSINKIRTQDDDNKFNSLVKIIFDIGNILKTERVSRNITQEELAKKACISRSTVSLCENNNNINLDVIKKCIIILKGIDILNKNLSQKRVHREI